MNDTTDKNSKQDIDSIILSWTLKDFVKRQETLT